MEFLKDQTGLIAIVVAVVICLNIALSAFKAILEKVKDLTPSEADNKLYDKVRVVSDWIGKIADWMSANIEHKK